jgi:hypothetical protein
MPLLIHKAMKNQHRVMCSLHQHAHLVHATVPAQDHAMQEAHADAQTARQKQAGLVIAVDNSGCDILFFTF